MLNRLKFILLPIAGGLSAFLSFIIAAPYIGTLSRPNLSLDDPESHFTYGTMWTNVQHVAFGALLCGSFCFILQLGRRTPIKVIQATIIGALLGAITNSIADSGSDLIGITAMKRGMMGGQGLGMVAWCILVPASLAFTVMIGIGLTKQRVFRAIYATFIAAVATFAGKIVGSMVGAAFVMSKSLGDLQALAKNPMQLSIPAWECEAVAAGVALGLTMFMADRVSRRGSLRLVYGRNEYRDWSLDYSANRIGSGEVEIPIRGFRDVQPIHSCIFRNGPDFIFDSQHAPALLNGHPVQQAVLNHGDTIQIGEATLVFYGSGAVRGNFRPAYQPQMHQDPMASSFPPQGVIQPCQQPISPMAGQQPPNGHGQVPIPAPIPAPVAVITTPQCFLNDSFGRQFELAPGSNSVGREVGNSIVIANDTTVSRNHAQLLIDANGVTLSDLGSSNGTTLNGSAVTEPTAVRSGDVIAFGKSSMTVRIIA